MKQTKHKLYWTNAYAEPCCEIFTDLSQLLKASERLRKTAKESKVTFIASASEYGDEIIGQQGVDVVDADYDWKKRRT